MPVWDQIEIHSVSQGYDADIKRKLERDPKDDENGKTCGMKENSYTN